MCRRPSKVGGPVRFRKRKLENGGKEKGKVYKGEIGSRKEEILASKKRKINLSSKVLNLLWEQ